MTNKHLARQGLLIFATRPAGKGLALPLLTLPGTSQILNQNISGCDHLSGSLRVARRAQGQPDLPDAGIAVIEKAGHLSDRWMGQRNSFCRWIERLR